MARCNNFELENFQLDVEQYNMVKEALHERAAMLQSAPHLTHPLPIMLPVYKYVDFPSFLFRFRTPIKEV